MALVLIHLECFHQVHGLGSNALLFPMAMSGAEKCPEKAILKLGVTGHLYMLKDIHMSPEQEVLKSASHPFGGYFMGIMADQIMALQFNVAFGRLMYAGYQIKNRCLAGTVGSDQADNMPRFKDKIVIMDRPQPTEIVSHSIYAQECH
jgi:hypothetical protein